MAQISFDALVAKRAQREKKSIITESIPYKFSDFEFLEIIEY